MPRRILTALNSLAALGLLLAFTGRYIPTRYWYISPLSNAYLYLAALSAAFMVYWMLQEDKRFLISATVLLLSFPNWKAIYGFNQTRPSDAHALKVMSYNVRLFNRHEYWIDAPDIPEKIYRLISGEKPDIICFQEFENRQHNRFKDYPYHYISSKGKERGIHNAIFSKYQVVHSGNIDLKKGADQASFVDVVVRGDTMRVVNVHLESLHLSSIQPHHNVKGKRILRLLAQGLRAHDQQITRLQSAIDASPYPIILAADLNATAFSNEYYRISQHLNCGFEKTGKGFGFTFSFEGLPLRIDFIFASDEFEFQSYKSIARPYSDHYPVVSELKLRRPRESAFRNVKAP